VRTDGPCELPHPLDSIQFGTVRRKKIQAQYIPVLCEPSLQCFGMMPSGIIDHHDHATSARPVPQELLEKPFEGCGIESVSFHPGNQTAVMVGHRTKDGNRLACGRMQQRRILLFRRNPHPAPGTMLLEMTFVFKPEISAWISSHATEFFYMHAVLQGQREQSEAGVFSCEIPIA